jgi:bifunctional DNA-binding transcriptional regulator/antitoxin component of YhaV-PrlF toxin-antitoxin module
MAAFHVRILEGGKIVIPGAVRRKHGFAVGKALVVEDTAAGVTLRLLDDAVGNAQAIMAKMAPPERRLSDELIAERRAGVVRN